MSDLTVHRFGTPGAPVLVLVHGLSDDGTCWPDAVAHWGGAWEIHALAQRGHGTSPRFRADQLADATGVLQADLTRVLTEIGRPAGVVGHSLGGLVAARVGRDRPDLVRALVLEDPARPPEPGTDRTEFAHGMVAFVDQVTHHREAEIARMATETPWTTTELEPWADSKARVDRDYLRAGLDLGEAGWEHGLFDALDVPTLVIVPEGGEMAPDLTLIDNPLVRRVDVVGAGHCVRRDRPAAFYAEADAFLATV